MNDEKTATARDRSTNWIAKLRHCALVRSSYRLTVSCAIGQRSQQGKGTRSPGRMPPKRALGAAPLESSGPAAAGVSVASVMIGVRSPPADVCERVVVDSVPRSTSMNQWSSYPSTINTA